MGLPAQALAFGVAKPQGIKSITIVQPQKLLKRLAHWDESGLRDSSRKPPRQRFIGVASETARNQALFQLIKFRVQARKNRTSELGVSGGLSATAAAENYLEKQQGKYRGECPEQILAKASVAPSQF